MRVHVMIATPSPGVVRAGYVRTLVATIADLTQNGVGSSYSISEGGDVAHQRNLLAARFLKSEATHLFWIDSDMSFEGGLCRRMLAARKPVVGAVYCTKEHNPDRRAWHEWSADAAVEVRGGLAPIDTLAFGVILVRRDVFTTMVDKAPRLCTLTATAPSTTSLRPDATISMPASFYPRTWPSAAAGASIAAGRSGLTSTLRSATSATTPMARISPTSTG